MKIFSTIMFIALTNIFFNFSTSYATEVIEKKSETVWSSQFDPRLAREYIKEEKEVSRKQGFEEGVEKGIENSIEKGRFEKAKVIALHMLSRGMQESEIAELTDLSPQQIQELKASLK